MREEDTKDRLDPIEENCLNTLMSKEKRRKKSKKEETLNN